MKKKWNKENEEEKTEKKKTKNKYLKKKKKLKMLHFLSENCFVNSLWEYEINIYY